MSSDVYVDFAPAVKQQLRGLEPIQREAVVEAVYEGVPTNGKPLLPGNSRFPLYGFRVDIYVFVYREMKPRELERAGVKDGYLVFEMKEIPNWIIRHLR